MKQLLFLCSVMLCGYYTQAQFTINANVHSFYPGLSFAEHSGNDDVSSLIQQSGPNQTWDMSNLSTTASTALYDDPANGSASASNPDATVYVTLSGGIEYYYKVDATATALVGFEVPNQISVTFSDFKEFLRYPTNYGDSYTDTYKGQVISSGTTIDREGTLIVTCDGYGDLMLPYGTIPNVMKVTVIDNYEDAVGGIPWITYSDTLLFFYNQNTKKTVASFGKNTSSIAPNIYFTTYMDQKDVVLNTKILDLADSPYSLYPNPAKDKITFENTSQNHVNISITNYLGQEIQNLNCANSQEIDLSKMAPGIYVLQCQDGQQYYTQKFTISPL